MYVVFDGACELSFTCERHEASIEVRRARHINEAVEVSKGAVALLNVVRCLHFRTPQVLGEQAHEAVVEERFADWSFKLTVSLFILGSDKRLF